MEWRDIYRFVGWVIGFSVMDGIGHIAFDLPLNGDVNMALAALITIISAVREKSQ